MTGTPEQLERMAHARAHQKGRSPRATEVKAQRRRRSSSTLDRMMHMTLDIFAPEQLDKANYEYRWVSDVGNRVNAATKIDDYDFVLPAEIKGFDAMPDSLLTESKDRIRTFVETSKHGQPIYAYLCRKPKEFFEEDQRARMQMRHDMMEGRVFNGEANFSSPAVKGDNGEVAAVKEQSDNFYIPAGNRLGQVTRRKRASA